jgi:uncharacterized protein YecE (DUF72 family)
MARWLVGTSVYRDWRTRFYPHIGCYGGSYTDAMLRDDAARVAGWTRGGRDVYVYFNNDGRAAAVRNARRLTELLEARPGRRRAA